MKRLRDGRIDLLRLALALLVTLAWTGGTDGQVTYDGCLDIRGIPVASVLDYSINDVAVASLAWDGSPIVRYNPRVLSWFRSETQLFWYGHECGHHALGHAFGTAHLFAVEQQADCFAVRELLRVGAISHRDLRGIQGDLAKLARGDWTHLPGPVRAINLERCLDGGERGSGSRRECTHPAHPRGDRSPCIHQAHPRGDLVPCQHVCVGPWGAVACHPNGDVWPCTHPAHPAGDVSRCVHAAHPGGH